MRRMRDRAHTTESWMRNVVLPAAHTIERAGLRHPHTVARLGTDTYKFLADWLDQLASELDRQSYDA